MNKIPEGIQIIKIGEGCLNNCEYCKEPKQIKVYDFPNILSDRVKVTDMNILSYPEPEKILFKLATSGAEIDLICGVDYRRLNPTIARILSYYRFGRFSRRGEFKKFIRIAWDGSYSNINEIRKAIDLLKQNGFKSNQISVFMLVNWKIHYAESLQKLESLKYWGVYVADCCFDGGYPANEMEHFVRGFYWSYADLKDFRRRSRKHNQLINFNGIDPEYFKGGKK